MRLGMMGPKEIQEDEDEELQRIKDNKKREKNMGHYRESEETEDINDVDTKQSPAKRAGGKKAVDRMEPTDWEEEGTVSNERSNDRSAAPSARRASVGNTRAPAVFIHARPSGRRRDSIRRKILTNSHANTERDRSRSPAAGQTVTEEDTEEIDEDAGDGETVSAPEVAHLSRSSSRKMDQQTSRGRPVLSPAGSTISSRSNASNQYPPRPASPTRPTAIRFATETAPSSDTVPSGMKAYGTRSPSGGNAGLAMYRSSSVQSTDSQKSDKSKRFSILGRFGQ